MRFPLLSLLVKYGSAFITVSIRFSAFCAAACTCAATCQSASHLYSPCITIHLKPEYEYLEKVCLMRLKGVFKNVLPSSVIFDYRGHDACRNGEWPARLFAFFIAFVPSTSRLFPCGKSFNSFFSPQIEVFCTPRDKLKTVLYRPFFSGTVSWKRNTLSLPAPKEISGGRSA